MTLITAIDPGTHESAVIHWNGTKVLSHAILPNDDLLRELRLRPAMQATGLVAVEMIASYGMPVGREVFETCLLIGRIQEICGPATRLVYRKDVKLHLCQSARAKDGNIRQALIDRFGPPGLKKSPGVLYGIRSHEWAALAVAVYAFDNPTTTDNPTTL